VAFIVHIEAMRKPHVIGYVTKYLTKNLTHDERGKRQEEREGIHLVRATGGTKASVPEGN